MLVFGLGVASAQAVELTPAKPRQDTTPPAPMTVSVFEPVTDSSVSPALGGTLLGVLPTPSVPAVGSPLDAAAPHDFAASYLATADRRQFGFFGGYTSRENLYESSPTTGWNLGGSLGYNGFYLRAGVSSDANELGQRLYNDANKGWLAGVGYQTSAFNFRITYMAAQPTGAFANSLVDHELDKRLWMVGGIYELTPRIRLNADAFTGTRDYRGTANILMAAPTAAAPQGTGARVGIQLKF